MKKLFMIGLLGLILLSLAAASPDEAIGRVTHVVDGDTIDVALTQHDSRISADDIRVRLADVDSPEMSTPQGPIAKAYTTKWLQSKIVHLDIDDKAGTDSYGRWVAVVYLQTPNGTLTNFNRMLVDSGDAGVWDFSNNEFSPADWWGGKIPAAVPIKSDSSSSTASPQIGGTSSAGADSGVNSNNYAASNGPFVGSAKSDKYHYPGCSAAKKIKPSNLVTFASSADARARGYVPCGICHPP